MEAQDTSGPALPGRDTTAARALDISPDWLGGLPPREPDQEELLKAYRALDEAHQGVVLNMVRAWGSSADQEA